MTPAKIGDRTMAWKITVQATRRTEGKPQDMFLMVDGLKIARRGYPDTPEAGTWVPIEPGWEVKDVLGGNLGQVHQSGQRRSNYVSGGGTPMTVYGYACVSTNGQTLMLRSPHL